LNQKILVVKIKLSFIFTDSYNSFMKKKQFVESNISRLMELLRLMEL